MDDVDAKKSSIYKVAIASTDGETVNQHYGRSDRFYVYLVDDNEGYDFSELRNVEAICMDGEHSDLKMVERLSNFGDCRYVVASKIGTGASASLRSVGIIGMELPGTVDDAILAVWKYNRIQGLFNK